MVNGLFHNPVSYDWSFPLSESFSQTKPGALLNHYWLFKHYYYYKNNKKDFIQGNWINSLKSGVKYSV